MPVGPLKLEARATSPPKVEYAQRRMPTGLTFSSAVFQNARNSGLDVVSMSAVEASGRSASATRGATSVSVLPAVYD